MMNVRMTLLALLGICFTGSALYSQGNQNTNFPDLSLGKVEFALYDDDGDGTDLSAHFVDTSDPNNPVFFIGKKMTAGGTLASAGNDLTWSLSWTTSAPAALTIVKDAMDTRVAYITGQIGASVEGYFEGVVNVNTTKTTNGLVETVEVESILRIWVTAQNPALFQATTTMLPDAVVGQPYSEKIEYSGGVLPYSILVNSQTNSQHALPPSKNLKFTPSKSGSNHDKLAGLVSGTPAVADIGTWIVDLRARDDLNDLDPTAGTAPVNNVYMFNVVAASAGIPFSASEQTDTLEDAVKNQSYAELLYAPAGTAQGDSPVFDVIGGSGSYTFAMSAEPGSSLPSNIALVEDSSDGRWLLSGTEGITGTHDFTFHIEDASDPTAFFDSSVYTLTIFDSGTISLAPLLAEMPDGMVSYQYSLPMHFAANAMFSLEGGSGKYIFTMSSATSGKLPVGKSALGEVSTVPSSPSFWILLGTPSFAGSFQVNFHVVDANNPHDFADAGPFDWTVYSNLTVGPAHTLADAYETVSYFDVPPAFSGGSGNYTFALKYSDTWMKGDPKGSGEVPSGLDIDANTGNLTAVFTQNTAGTYVDFKIEITDQANSSWKTDTICTLTILPANQYSPPLVVTSESLPQGEESVVYSSIQLQAFGGTKPYDWSSTTGLPQGLTINQAGLISGTPVLGTASQVHQIDATVTDALGDVATQALTLIVNPAGTTIIITTTSLPIATEGMLYDASVFATSADSSFHWSASNLPAGLAMFRDETGQWKLYGVPNLNSAGSQNVMLSVTNKAGGSAVGQFNLTIAPTASTSTLPKLTVATNFLPDATVGVTYGPINITATGGAGDYDFSDSSGLPAGMTIIQGGGSWRIVGFPTEDSIGEHTIALLVSDAAFNTSVRFLTLSVHSQSSPANTQDLLEEGEQVAQTLLASGAAAGCSLTTTSSGLWWALTLFSVVVASRRYRRKA